MAEHPQTPMHNFLHPRYQVTGKASTSYVKLVYKLYADASSDTTSMTEDSDLGFQIYEVNNNTNYNYVRTLLNKTVTITDTSYENPSDPGGLVFSETLNFNTDPDTYYVVRLRYNASEGWGFGVIWSTAAEGNGYNVSQASDFTEFTNSTDADVETAIGPVLGSGFPDSAFADDGGSFAFRPAHNGEAIWSWVNLG